MPSIKFRTSISKFLTYVAEPEIFADYFKEKPIQVFLLMKQMSRRLRDTTQNYVEACRTVAETMEKEQKGEEKGSWLDNKLKAFADVYRKLLGEDS